MLILSRKPGEVIHINDDITITILGINGNQIRMGFISPKAHAIHRSEIYDKIQIQKKHGIVYVSKNKFKQEELS